MGEDKSLYILANILGQRGDHRGSQLAALVANCRDPAALQRFACACAEHALVATGLRDPVLSDALVFACSLVGAHLSARIAKVRGSVARIVESLDQKAFDAQDAEEVGKASRRAYLEAFHRARAGNNVLECLDPSPVSAAVRCYYEAYYATEDIGTLFALGEQMLR